MLGEDQWHSRLSSVGHVFETKYLKGRKSEDERREEPKESRVAVSVNRSRASGDTHRKGPRKASHRGNEQPGEARGSRLCAHLAARPRARGRRNVVGSGRRTEAAAAETPGR